MKTLGQLYPPFLLLMILFVQAVSLFINYSIFDSRELVIFLSWIPIFTIPYFLVKKKFIYSLTVTVFFIDGFLNLCHLLILNGPFTASSLFVMSNTNMDEAKDFLDLKSNFLMLLLLPYLFFYVMALRTAKPVVVYPKSKYIVGAMLLVSLGFAGENMVHKRFIRKGIPQTEEALVSFANELKTFNALKKRKVVNVQAKLLTQGEDGQICVVIIGESCSRNHMSLYTYPKKTTPRLDKRNDLIPFTNAVSPYSNTQRSVLSILTEFNLQNKMSYDKSMSLIDVFHSSGFKTYWISNQSPIGAWDNAIYNLAQTSDITIFVNNNGNSSFESTYLSSYDERLLQPFVSVLKDPKKNKFIVLHLMGSHASYIKRYPPEYNKFSSYMTSKEKLINEYDNSMTYTDFVTDSLFNILKSYCTMHPKTLCSAIYLSDHGENVYDENGVIGHTHAGSLPKSNVEIPFLVWLSPGYIRLHNEKQKTILKNKDLPFVTDDLFHAVIDLNNIEYNRYIKSRSVFNSEFNCKRPRILEDNMDYDLK